MATPMRRNLALAGLTDDERRVVAVLAVVGRASLSAEELAALAAVEDVGPLLAKLERLGLITKDERGRRALRSGPMHAVRRAWETADTAERVLRQFIEIAKDGKLTVDDLDAVLGVAEWAAQAGRLTELLALVEAAGTAVSVTKRIEAWLQTLRLAHAAARELRDGAAEDWIEEQLERVRRHAGVTGVGETVELEVRRTPWTRSPVFRALAGALVVVAAGAGVAVGYAVADDSEVENGSTVTLPGSTVTLPAETVTAGGTTVTLPGETVTTPGTTVTLPAETVTTTVVTTVTTTVGNGVE